jgi:O-antigen/teichoic acid export membrane protein
MPNLITVWQHTRSSSLARNAGWMLVGQGLSIICQGLYFVIVGRLLGATEYGIYVGAVAIVAIFSQYSPLGSDTVLLRYVSNDPKNFALYWGNVLATTFTLGGLFVLVLTWFGPHAAHSFSRGLVVCVALGDCVCAQLTIASCRVFQAFEKMRLTAAVSLLVNMSRMVLAGGMLLVLHHGTAGQWAIAALIISTVAALTALGLVTRLYGKPAFSSALLRRRGPEGFVFALSYSTTGVYNDIDKAMLGHYGMNTANGIYTMAYRVIDVCTSPIVAIQSAAIPRFFRKGNEGVTSAARYSIRIVKRTAPLALLSAFAVVAAAPIIPHLAGKGFFESISAVRWLCLLPVFRSFQLSAGDAITGAGYQKLRLGCQAFAAAFNFGSNLYLIPRYSWRGAAGSSLVTDALLAVVNWTLLFWLTSEYRGSQQNNRVRTVFAQHK